MRNKRKTRSIMMINALKSLPGHHSCCRLTQADVFWGKLDGWWGGEGCQQAVHWGKSTPSDLPSLQVTAHLYRFQCTRDTLNWGRRIRGLIPQPGDGSKPTWDFFPFKIVSGHALTRRKNISLTTAFSKLRKRIRSLVWCFFPHVLCKAEILIHNQTYANIWWH